MDSNSDEKMEIKENNALNSNSAKIEGYLCPPSHRAENPQKSQSNKPVDSLEKIGIRTANNSLTEVIALDCEMVGIGSLGLEDVLARVSIVNYFGECIFDRYVHIPEKVTDYRTYVSGIHAEDLENGHVFADVMADVHSILKDRIVVGHDLRKDFKLLYISHSAELVRDTSDYDVFRKMFYFRRPSLKNLASLLLGIRFQEGEHSSITDAAVAMKIYKLYRNEWEDDVKEKYKINNS